MLQTTRTNLMKKLFVLLIALFALHSYAQQNNEDASLWRGEPFGTQNMSKEIVDKRDEFSKHFDKGDGQITAHIASGPIHYEENGEWKTIYHTISPSANGFENIHNSFKTYYPATATGEIKTILPNGGTISDMISMKMYFEANGQKINVQSIKNTEGKVNFNELTYPNVYGTGIDLLLTQHTTKRKMDYVIHSLEALENIPNDANYLVFEETVELPQGWKAELKNNVIYLIDGRGEVQAQYEKPILTDAPFANESLQTDKTIERSALEVNSTQSSFEKRGSQKEINNHTSSIRRSDEGIFEINQNGNSLKISLKVEVDWLKSEDRVFPVKIDPTINVTPNNATDWTRSVEQIYIKNNGVIGYEDWGWMYLGLDESDCGWFSCSNGNWLRSFAKFNLSSIPCGSNISSANGYLYLEDGVGGTSTGGRTYQWTNANDPTLGGGAALFNSPNIAYSASVPVGLWGVGWRNATPLNTTALTAIQNNVGGSFSCAINPTGEWTFGQWMMFSGHTVANRPYIVIEYIVPQPTVNVGGSIPSICQGETTISLGGSYGGSATSSTWSSSVGGSFTNNGGTTPNTTTWTPPVGYSGTAMLTLTASDACGNTVTTSKTITVNPSPSTPTITHSPINNICLGTNITYSTASGKSNYTWTIPGVAGIDYDLISGGGSTNENLIIAWKNENASTGINVNYTENACFAMSPGTSQLISLPSKGNVLSGNESATCYVNGSNSVLFYGSGTGNGYLGAVNANGGNLGNVTMTSVVGSPAFMEDCVSPDNTNYHTAYMGRRWLMTSDAYPNGSSFGNQATVELPYTTSELSTLNTYAQTATPDNPFDGGAAAAIAANLMLTKITGGIENGSADLSDCGGTRMAITQSGNGTNTQGIANTEFVTFGVEEFSEFFLHKTNEVNSPLPVELSHFSASCDEHVEILWVTESELNADKFIVEKSRNGVNWELVDELAAAGNSNSHLSYSTTDKKSYHGVSYYRLRQVDFDGKEKIYGPISVSCTDNGNNINVYPNPNNGNFTVEINSPSDIEEASLQLFDVTGKLIASREFQIVDGVTQIMIEETQSLKPGTYVLKVIADVYFEPVKIVVK